MVSLHKETTLDARLHPFSLVSTARSYHEKPSTKEFNIAPCAQIHLVKPPHGVLHLFGGRFRHDQALISSFHLSRYSSSTKSGLCAVTQTYPTQLPHQLDHREATRTAIRLGVLPCVTIVSSLSDAQSLLSTTSNPSGSRWLFPVLRSLYYLPPPPCLSSERFCSLVTSTISG